MSTCSADEPAADPALAPPPVLAPPGRKYADDTRRWQGIPGIERAANGRLWAVWYSGGDNEGPENYVVLVTSDDDGKTWSGPRLVVDPPGNVRAFDPCLWHDPGGRLWLFWAQCWSPRGGRVWDGRGGVWAITTRESDSPDPSWSKPRRLCDGVMMNKPMVPASGEWLLPAAVWTLKPRFEDRRYERFDADRCGSNVIVSMDEGKTWEFRGKAVVPESACDEHMIVQRTDASLWMLVRTRYGIGESCSKDGGASWTPGKPSSIAHPTARFFIRRLASGKLLLVKHGPLNERIERSHLTAYLSDDDGKSWSGGLLLDERKYVSYPDGIQAPDGRIYVIYDRERHKAREILMAVFTEEDVAEGKCVSGKSRLRVLVNRASER